MHENEASHGGGHVSESSSSHRSHRHRDYKRLERHGRHMRRMEKPRRDNLESLDALLDWKIKVKKLFVCHNIHEKLKVKLVTLEFNAYALVWWYQIMYDVRNMRRPPCETWTGLKKELRDRFVPSYYVRDLFVKFKGCFKGLKV
ncbi:hypothetical protein CR513_06818, partial [Mucuna pruriens]